MPRDTPTERPASGGTTNLDNPRFEQWLLNAARVVMMIGIASLVLASATLVVLGAVNTVRYVFVLASSSGDDLTNKQVFLASIKLVDLVLLATVLQVVAIGVYCLFINSEIRVPAWLHTNGVDDLKQKLAGIVAVMLGVLFLEEVINADGDRELLALGIAIAAVIAALSYFISAHPGGD